jgi:hypothetical protein
MNCVEIRRNYPKQWVVIEALQAHTTSDHRRILDQGVVIEQCADGKTAMQSYQRLHREYPIREFYFVHTSREEIDIREQQWIGIRRAIRNSRSMFDNSETRLARRPKAYQEESITEESPFG